jgi:RNA-binding protein 8A
MHRREARDEYSIIERSYKGTKGIFQMIDQEKGPGPGKSVEGYIIVIRNLNEEVQEDNIHDLLAKFGKIRNLHLNLDKQSGYAKGYCLLEYEKFDKAEKAIKFLQGREFLGTKLQGK